MSGERARESLRKGVAALAAGIGEVVDSPRIGYTIRLVPSKFWQDGGVLPHYDFKDESALVGFLRGFEARDAYSDEWKPEKSGGIS